jgi:hypothetical protein
MSSVSFYGPREELVKLLRAVADSVESPGSEGTTACSFDVEESDEDESVVAEVYG